PRRETSGRSCRRDDHATSCGATSRSPSTAATPQISQRAQRNGDFGEPSGGFDGTILPRKRARSTQITRGAQRGRPPREAYERGRAGGKWTWNASPTAAVTKLPQ